MPEQVGQQGIDVNRIFVLRSAGKTQYLGSRGIALVENGAKQAAVRAGTSTCHRFEKFKYGAQGKSTAVYVSSLTTCTGTSIVTSRCSFTAALKSPQGFMGSPRCTLRR